MDKEEAKIEVEESEEGIRKDKMKEMLVEKEE